MILFLALLRTCLHPGPGNSPFMMRRSLEGLEGVGRGLRFRLI
jgi:hypothetical protein